MDPALQELRTAIVDEAKTWLRTRWLHGHRLKGHGVDCGGFVASVWVAVGILEWPMIFPEGQSTYYPHDWMFHRSEEVGLNLVATFADQIKQPLPGDAAVWKFGRCYSHAGIVIDWPTIIHAYLPERGVVWGDASRGPIAAKPVRFYSRLTRLQREAAKELST